MKIYDISLTITEEIPCWPGDQKPKIEKTHSFDKGDIANVSKLTLSAHTGTHVDAPSHFLQGENSVEQLPLDTLIGEALVIEIPNEKVLTRAALEKANIPPGTIRLLIKTPNSELWKTAPAFTEDYVGISADGAQYLVDLGIRLIGVDYLSVATMEDMVATHEILLGSSTIIVEGLNLAEVPSGAYTLCCLPLKIQGTDGAPTRAVLLAE